MPEMGHTCTSLTGCLADHAPPDSGNGKGGRKGGRRYGVNWVVVECSPPKASKPGMKED